MYINYNEDEEIKKLISQISDLEEKKNILLSELINPIDSQIVKLRDKIGDRRRELRK